ncbi:MAG: [FeFe] hydrogenase H-cluster radical SAM maturase HydE, partial [Candidatus Cloacimonadaceae bacterium]|nr:[FeFe] hydrogenase H-cluster radical SAM maturase HydE [Candidatus Cloacimonadaceae bacterium]
MRPDKHELIRLLSLSNAEEIEQLYKRAYEVKKQYVGTVVYFRGIIELSNICTKNCYYCGIRRENSNVNRYLMEYDEVMESALWSYKQGYGSIVIQSG